jgi:hypothetical protein
MSATPIVVTKKDVKRGAWHYLKPALMILLSLRVFNQWYDPNFVAVCEFFRV